MCRKDSKAIPDIKRDEKLAKITEIEEAVEAKVKTDTDKQKEAPEKKTTQTNKKAVNGDVTQKDAAKDKYVAQWLFGRVRATRLYRK